MDHHTRQGFPRNVNFREKEDQERPKAAFALAQYVQRSGSLLFHELPIPSQLLMYSLNQASASLLAIERAVAQASCDE